VRPLTAYLIKRVFLLVPVLLGITVIVFFLIHLIPGNPAVVMLGDQATPQAIARLDHELGLDQPMWLQFIDYIGRLLQGNLGQSITESQSVVSLIAFALPNTLVLAVFAMVVALIIALPLGIASAVWRNSPLDFAGMVFAQLGVSMPVFWLGTLLVEAFALTWHIFPSFGLGAPVGTAFAAPFHGDAAPLAQLLAHMFLPGLTLGLTGAALISRMVRSAMVDVLGQDFIRTARAKGVGESRVVLHHALRNALVVVVTVVGLQFGFLLGGAVIVETIFAWPGMGRLTVNSILARDFPTVQGCILVFAMMFALVNLLVDMSYAVLDPKVHYE